MPRRLVPILAAAVLLLSVPAIVSTASARQDAPAAPSQPPQENHQRRPIPRPTNLQVLPKDISTTDLIATMRSYTGALGVECTFCHAEDPQTHRPNFAADTNPDKGIARTMISMTNEINAKYLSQVKDPDATPAQKTVTCGTCHRGNSMPTPFAPIATPGQHHDHPGAPEPKPQ
jgi:hypothetical protein